MLLNQDFKEFLQSLNDNNVQYLIIGGYAVAFHGHPRYTKDIDIWVAADKKNITNLLKALKDFGFASLELTSDDFNPEQIIQLGYPPNRIDLLTDDYKRCPENRFCPPDVIQAMLPSIRRNRTRMTRMHTVSHGSKCGFDALFCCF